ncbi:hypothetical protein JCM9534A_72640 [Catenuloplanes indicus JCM 9534]|uniref:FixJ family two-component response regulator n=1 Tax=Catenuloplanes indicus TaxID=137267 RepID=A0AAE3W7T9_9ACTN|nr:FixJ family two-component response regulator [Catenuloplanes indicus]
MLDGIARGLRNRANAAELRLSEHTVKFHVLNLLGSWAPVRVVRPPRPCLSTEVDERTAVNYG